MTTKRFGEEEKDSLWPAFGRASIELGAYRRWDRVACLNFTENELTDLGRSVRGLA